MKVDTGKIRKAQILLDMLVENLEDIGDERTAYVETYQNGRENGFTVTLWTKDLKDRNSVTFSEARGTDQIVVYLDNIADQGLDDAAYVASKYFRYDAYKSACRYCVRHLIFGLKK